MRLERLERFQRVLGLLGTKRALSVLCPLPSVTVREELDRIPISSVRMGEITQRKKRDAQKNHLQKLAKRLGFSLEFDGETAWIFWPNWAKRQGLKPRIRDELATNPVPISGEIEKEIEKERERETTETTGDY